MNIEYLPVKLLDAFVSLDISETWRSELIYDPRKVYFPLRELEPNNEYPNIFSENLAEWAHRHELNIPAESFYDWLHNRDTLILFDGLDEISDLDQCKRVCEWIDNEAKGIA